jgi:hypothetical protein
MLKRRILIVGAAAMGAAPPARADPPVWTVDGIAAGHADVVAYFTRGAVTRGNDGIATVWRKETWIFENADNRTKFAATPEAFAPQYGGFCCMAMTEGKKSNGSSMAWAIHKGKLYFAGSPAVLANWKLDPDKNISKADYWWKRSFASL